MAKNDPDDKEPKLGKFDLDKLWIDLKKIFYVAQERGFGGPEDVIRLALKHFVYFYGHEFKSLADKIEKDPHGYTVGWEEWHGKVNLIHLGDEARRFLDRQVEAGHGSLGQIITQSLNVMKALRENDAMPVPDNTKAIQKALRELLAFVPHDKPAHFNKKNPYYSEGDETAPFFTEGYTYPLLGKEDARSLRGYLRAVLQAAGFSDEQRIENF